MISAASVASGTMITGIKSDRLVEVYLGSLSKDCPRRAETLITNRDTKLSLAAALGAMHVTNARCLVKITTDG
jgi:hypothetical protein